MTIPPPGPPWPPPGGHQPPTYPGRAQYPGPAPFPPGPAPAGIGPGAPFPPPQQRTSGLAIAALVLGIIGGAFVVGSLIGIVLGIVALAQIRRTGERGRGLAIAGIVLSCVWIVVIVIGILAVTAGSVQRDESGTVTAGGSTPVERVQVGDCLADLPDAATVRTMQVVPCGQPHTGEVFASYDSPSGAYPGRPQVEEEAERRCPGLLDGYARGADDLGLFTLVPTPESWRAGDRTTQCIATTATPRSGSIRTR